MAPVKPGSALGHTARYLADKIRAKKAAREKRKDQGLPESDEDEPRRAMKRIRRDADDVNPQQIEDLKVKGLQKWTEQMQAGTDNIYKSIYGEHWEEGKKYELEKLSQKQAEHQRQQADYEAAHTERVSIWKKSHAALTDPGIYKDDYDPRH